MILYLRSTLSFLNIFLEYVYGRKNPAIIAIAMLHNALQCKTPPKGSSFYKYFDTHGTNLSSKNHKFVSIDSLHFAKSPQMTYVAVRCRFVKKS